MTAAGMAELYFSQPPHDAILPVRNYSGIRPTPKISIFFTWIPLSSAKTAMAGFHPVAVNGTLGDTAAILWLKMQTGTYSRSIWITAIAASKAGGWSPGSTKKGRPGLPKSPLENNRWTYRLS